MARTLKILLGAALILFLIALAAAITGWFLLRGTPEWYRPRENSADRERVAAASVEDKLIRVYDWVGAARARRVRQAESATHAPAATKPLVPETFQVQFTDEELNAFFDKWADAGGRRAALEQYVDNPRLVLRDNQLILAATVKEMGTVVSMEFQPQIDEQGKLQMNLQKVLGGILPLPEALWTRQRDRVASALERKLPGLQQSSDISSDGAADAAAAMVGMNELVLAALNRQPAEPVLFMPFDVRHPGRSDPMKLTAVSIESGKISLTVQEMSPAQRQALLEKLHAPYDSGSASPP